MKNLKPLYYLTFIALLMALLSCSFDKEFIPFGEPDIDRVRKEVMVSPTDSENFDVRVNTLSLWMRFMMFYGADVVIDPQKYKEKAHYFYNDVDENGRYILKASEYSPETAVEIDYRYNMLEEMWTDFSKDKDQYIVELNRDLSDNNGEIINWSSLRGDPQLTAATTEPGPMKGEVHWKYPTPHMWLTRPAFDKGRAYVGSPGVSYLAYCIDTETGDYIWKSIPKGNGLRTRYYGPRSSSPVLIAGANMISRRTQARLGDEHFVYINKETGVQQKGIKNNEFLNSSSGYAPFDGNEEYLVYPQGIQPVVQGKQKLYVNQIEYRKIREDFPFDSLACKSTKTGKLIWKKYMGEFYAEPLLDNN
ncbi:hypothetical protein, partial [Aestuariivivens sediminis]|uniref:hypothetical protein n=1 Tax=Aestuariivivens sediminis TaxID=2913557 RepID=UPI001F56931F